jgi:hypothetical protein
MANVTSTSERAVSKSSKLPVSDKTLRDYAKNVAKILPKFEEKEPATGAK